MERAGTVVVIGGGPSLTREQVEYTRGRARVIAIKEAARLAPWADAFYCGDGPWMAAHRDEVQSFRGTVNAIEQEPGRHKLEAVLSFRPDLKIFRNDGTEGLCEDPAGLRTGCNSGYQAVNLAFHMLARRIVLLGYDLKAGANGRMHWFHRQFEHQPSAYLSWAPLFRTLVDPLTRHGVEVVNATPGSALDAFPRVTLQEALA